VSDNDTFPNRWVAGQICLNLAQFDPKTPYFDLMIDPAQILDIALRQKASQITGAIKT
jgi:hypothetical protein